MDPRINVKERVFVCNADLNLTDNSSLFQPLEPT